MSQLFNPAGPWKASPPRRARPRRGVLWLLGLAALIAVVLPRPVTRPGGTLAYINNERGNYNIYLMDTDGNRLGQLTTGSLTDSEPEWSPDGTRIVYSTEEDGNFEVFMMGRDGANPTNLTRDPSDDGGPVFSPACSQGMAGCTEKIAFFSNRDGDYDIYVMDADGGHVVRITNDPADDQWPVWSPDGERLAFMSLRSGAFWDIFVVEIRSGEV